MHHGSLWRYRRGYTDHLAVGLQGDIVRRPLTVVRADFHVFNVHTASPSDGLGLALPLELYRNAIDAFESFKPGIDAFRCMNTFATDTHRNACGIAATPVRLVWIITSAKIQFFKILSQRD